VERDDRPVVATFVVPTLAGRASITLPEGAAHHARVKRLRATDVVRLTDGAGRLALATLTDVRKSGVSADVDDCALVAPLPALHLFVPVADRDRMLTLAEKCVELGVTAWHPVRFARSRSVTPRGEGSAFDAKLHRRMEAALEQSAGAWRPEIHSPVEVPEAAAFVATTKLVFDATGVGVLALPVTAPVAALIGPEGGLEAPELELFREAGWQRARLAGNVLRFESAGIAAAAVLRAMLAR
jgi:16S rRNA (uracil1498-N3)-methyltransferase